MKSFMSFIGLLLVIGCIGQFSGTAGRHKGECTEVFENDISEGELSLNFQAYNGYIELHLWDEPRYRIELYKWARAATVEEAEEKAEALKIDISEKKEEGKMTITLTMDKTQNRGADVKAFLPRTPFNAVALSTTNGYIALEDIYADTISLQTTNGYCNGFITASTIDVKTANGRIEGFYHGDEVHLETTNGRIDVFCGEGGTYTMKTTNSSVIVQAGFEGDFTISTTNGDIDLLIEGDFTFDLRVSNGEILVEADEIMYAVDSEAHKKGSAGRAPQLTIAASTTNGSITVKKE